MSERTMTPLNLEQEALGSYNYLERLCDPDTGYTCFNVFLTDPAEAVHDWPDFLDVPGRSAESCVLLRHMTGRTVATEDAFFRRIYSFQDGDGLFHRPETPITTHQVYLEEQALVMGALLARAIGDDDAEAQDRLARLVLGLAAKGIAAGAFPAMLTRPLVRAYEAFGLPEALALLESFRATLMADSPLFRADGSFEGHVHSHEYAAAGLVELGRVTGDDKLIAAMDRVFRFVRAQSTAFGFVPEVAERKDDVIACETCDLMDYIHLALTLARTGHTEYYDDVERAVRNHLVESQVRHGDWLPTCAEAADDEYCLRSDVRDKVIGAYGGWSSPNHILAYDEYLPAAWVKTPDMGYLYLNKVRALQNCCGPSGPKAVHLAWQHASRVQGATLRINLLLDRALPEAQVKAFEPWEGKIEVSLRAPLAVAMRVPGFATGTEVRASVNGAAVGLRLEAGYAITPTLAAGDEVAFTYPLPEREETIHIGNAGRQQYEYRVTWKGSTVVRIEAGDNPTTGHSHLMNEPVRLYYGEEGPHPLYQRDWMLEAMGERVAVREAKGPEVW